MVLPLRDNIPERLVNTPRREDGRYRQVVVTAWSLLRANGLGATVGTGDDVLELENEDTCICVTMGDDNRREGRIQHRK